MHWSCFLKTITLEWTIHWYYQIWKLLTFNFCWSEIITQTLKWSWAISRNESRVNNVLWFINNQLLLREQTLLNLSECITQFVRIKQWPVRCVPVFVHCHNFSGSSAHINTFLPDPVNKTIEQNETKSIRKRYVNIFLPLLPYFLCVIFLMGIGFTKTLKLYHKGKNFHCSLN